MNYSGRVSRVPLVFLALALLGAAPSKHQLLADRATQGELPVGPISYLVTASGHIFRMLGRAPITDGDGKKLATMVSCEGDTRDVAAAALAAVELMGAVGPELQAAGETDAVIQTEVGFAPAKPFNTTAFHVTFELKDGRWTPLPLTPGRPKTLGSGPLEVFDDPDFGLDSKGLAEAAQLAGHWMATLGAGDSSGLWGDMSETFALEVKSRKGDWERFVAERALPRGNAQHRELYRLQTRSGGRALPGGRGVIVLYDVRYAKGGRSLDQVSLVRESGRWRVWTFASLPFRKAT